jgi:hypothetical protein
MTRKGDINWSSGENTAFKHNESAKSGLLNTPSLECSENWGKTVSFGD